MSKLNALHGRHRRECPVYSQCYDPANDKATQQVYRPHSERKISAVKELNRLSKHIATLEAQNLKLRKIACHVPPIIYMQAKSDAGWPTLISLQDTAILAKSGEK